MYKVPTYNHHVRPQLAPITRERGSDQKYGGRTSANGPVGGDSDTRLDDWRPHTCLIPDRNNMTDTVLGCTASRLTTTGVEFAVQNPARGIRGRQRDGSRLCENGSLFVRSKENL